MNEAKDAQLESDQSADPIDLRTELRSHLTDEFNTALSSCTALTDNQRSALSAAVSEGTVTTAAILQALGATKE
jgi:hypothetical protein